MSKTKCCIDCHNIFGNCEVCNEYQHKTCIDPPYTIVIVGVEL